MKLKKLIPARFRGGDITIPVVRLSGMIAPPSGGFRQNLSLATVAGPLKKAFEMKKAPVVALSVNSPGGSPVQSRLIYQRIRELAEKHKKRVLVFVEDVAASGGYMIAIAGDEIIADETSIVGSIGVVSAGFGFTQAIEKIGVERRVYTSGKNKSMLDPFKPEKKADIDHLKSLQAEIHTVFIDMVKQARGAQLAENDELFTGMFWTGAQAKEMGLIDTCGLMGEVIRERYGDKAELQLVQAKRGLFGRQQPGIGNISTSNGFAGEFGAGMAAGLPAALMETMEERSLWSRFGL
ncbi:MAG: S49 family peptidase [Rhizobiaceae bacterium]